jgi:hypothetical protein
MSALRFFGSLSRSSSPSSRAFFSWHHQPGQLHSMLVARAESAVNVNTARTLGLTMSWQLRLRADHVIE